MDFTILMSGEASLYHIISCLTRNNSKRHPIPGIMEFSPHCNSSGVCSRARGLMSKITEPVAREFICVVDYSTVMLSDRLAQNLGQRSRGEVILNGMSSESW